jgi:arylformamidase
MTTSAEYVFLEYTQAALDAAYDQQQWAKNNARLTRRFAARSNSVRERLGMPQRVAYGPGNAEHLDIFCTSVPRAPVFVFIHGGAWRANSSERYAYLAEAYVKAGAHVVLVDFDGVEATNGSLIPIIDQIRRAVAWVYTNAATFGADAGRIHIAGHSSGAHLTGCVLVTDWPAYGVPAGIVAGATVCSGMYELHPVSLSARSSYVTFDDETLTLLSSQRHLERITIPVVVGFGTDESPEFQRQGREYAAALAAAGKDVRVVVADGYNHFEIPATFANPYGWLGAAVFAQMHLTPGAAGA